jgi:histidinol phosphatase-like enzyme (inositol monophosphatase family)
MSPRLQFALDAAYEAGRFTLAHFQTALDVQTKANDTPVTVADQGAERMIRERLARAYPGEAILGEEEGGDQADDRWVIDPIDGTKSFIAGVPLYATLLSYEQAGEPIVGVAYFPALEMMVYAERGSGAFLNGRPCGVSARSTVAGAVLCCAGHKSMLQFGRAAGFDTLAPRALATRTWSDAYGHALVATGRADAMIDPIVAHYDLSAVFLIVREAGGRFTDFQGRDAISHEAISTNGHIHDEVLAAFS